MEIDPSFLNDITITATIFPCNLHFRCQAVNPLEVSDVTVMTKTNMALQKVDIEMHILRLSSLESLNTSQQCDKHIFFVCSHICICVAKHTGVSELFCPLVTLSPLSFLSKVLAPTLFSQYNQPSPNLENHRISCLL